jgi:hypothetical protein
LTASSVPHEALRIFGTGRTSGPIPVLAPAEAGSRQAMSTAANAARART